MAYTFFADESGHVTQEPGLSDLVGPSQYLCMGGCLVPDGSISEVRARLDSIQKEFKKTKFIHATDISHIQKLHLIRKLSRLELPFFGIISDKSTLRGFKTLSEGDAQQYYNRTALYLLNLLGKHLLKKDIDGSEVSIVFEHRGHDYSKFRNYVSKVARNPTGDSVDGIPAIAAQKIRTLEKTDEHLLAVPDIIAHSIFSAFDRNRNNFAITEARYLREIFPAFCEGSQPVRFHLIRPERMKSVCDDTSALLLEYGLKI